MKIFTISLSLWILFFSGCTKNKTAENQTTSGAAVKDTTNKKAYDLTVKEDGLSQAVATMNLEKGGTIKWRFYTKDAPKTAERIAELIAQGFYNGIKFHRV